MQDITVLPLHHGTAPRWLFRRMVRLGGLISEAVVEEYGETELLRRLSDSCWLQSLSNAIGYDWHSSGSTTVTMAALKEYLNGNSGIFIAGGKGRQGISAPDQIVAGTDSMSIPQKADEFVYLSRALAKIDSALVYDNIGIYHHTFAFSKHGDWTVVQQAMQPETHNAIRFQAFSGHVRREDITNETNTSVTSQAGASTLDLTFARNREAKEASLNLVRDDPTAITEHIHELPHRHNVMKADLSERSIRLLQQLNEMQPGSYEEMMMTKGVGRKTLKSLAMLSTLIYESDVYTRNPVLYSFNVGGKDGTPYRIDRAHYDSVVGEMAGIVKRIKIDKREESNALKRLSAGLRG